MQFREFGDSEKKKVAHRCKATSFEETLKFYIFLYKNFYIILPVVYDTLHLIHNKNFTNITFLGICNRYLVCKYYHFLLFT